MVVVSTPTDPATPPLSSHLAACTITMCASGSDVGGREVYTRVEDTPPSSRSQCESLEDSLRFQVEDDLESGDPSQGGHGSPFHDAASGHLVEVPGRDDYVGEVGEGREEELVDYGSSPECEAPESGPLRHELQADVHVVQQEGSGSDEVYFLNLHTFWFIFVFANFLARPCLFSSFVACDTNDVDLQD